MEEQFADWRNDDDVVAPIKPEVAPANEEPAAPEEPDTAEATTEGERKAGEASSMAEPSAGSSRHSVPDSALEPVPVGDLVAVDRSEDGTMVVTCKTVKDLNLPPGVGSNSRRTLIQVTDEEAAFVLGRGGRTKQKIARVSGARMNLRDDLTLEICGSMEQRERAELYVKLVIQQRRQRVTVNFGAENRTDLTVIDVPSNAIAFVTGQGGNVLRRIEDDWCTLMFFVNYPGEPKQYFPPLSEKKPGRRSRRHRSSSASKAAKANQELSSTAEPATAEPATAEPATAEPATAEPATADPAKADAKPAEADPAVSDIVVTQPDGAEAKADPEDAPMGDCSSPLDNSPSNGPAKSLAAPLKSPVSEASSAESPRHEARYSGDSERLLIFGDLRGRTGAALKVLTSIEMKNPGIFDDFLQTDHFSERDTFDVDRRVLSSEDLSYALGKDGLTRRKLANASRCILDYISRTAFFAGSKTERRACRDYLDWLIKQRRAPVHVGSTAGRKDLTCVTIDPSFVKAITGPRSVRLREIEVSTQTFIFVDAQNNEQGKAKVMIFGQNPVGRDEARKMLYEILDRFANVAADEYNYQPPSQRMAQHGDRPGDRPPPDYSRNGDFRRGDYPEFPGRGDSRSFPIPPRGGMDFRGGMDGDFPRGGEPPRDFPRGDYPHSRGDFMRGPPDAMADGPSRFPPRGDFPPPR